MSWVVSWPGSPSQMKIAPKSNENKKYKRIVSTSTQFGLLSESADLLEVRRFCFVVLFWNNANNLTFPSEYSI